MTTQETKPPGPILVVDDDDDVRLYTELTLSLEGFEVLSAAGGQECLDSALLRQPALVVQDVMMPDVAGLEAVRQLRAFGRTSHIPVILVTARSQVEDRVEGLEAGADDYITKPFDPEELIARVRTTLRRSEQMRTMSPLTGLPGNVRIEQELRRRLEQDRELSLLYIDMNSFKAINDHYGPLRGDEVIRSLARVITETVAEHGDAETFVGHVGGDDFVVIHGVDSHEDIAREVCLRFDRVAPDHYDPEDLERGYIEVENRRGEVAHFPPVTVSVGVATTARRDFGHPAEVMQVATEMKRYAKHHGPEERSGWAFDRRMGDA